MRVLLVGTIATYLIASAVAPPLVWGQASGNAANPIVPSASKLEKVFDSGVFLEGPAAAPDGSIYFSDLTSPADSLKQAGHLWRFDPKTGQATIYRSPSGQSNGIEFDTRGRMVVAEGADLGGRRISRSDLATGRTALLATQFRGRPLNGPNDLAIDRQGRIYFTDPRYDGSEPVEQPVMGVYRIDPDGSIHLIIGDVGKPNGIVVSPDQRTLYVIALDDGHMGPLPPRARALPGVSAILAYDLSADGSVTFRKSIVEYSRLDPLNGADGMTVDVEGNLYAASLGTKPGVHIYRPDGTELAYIPTPVDASNVEFGRGADRNLLYITAGKSLYRIRLLKGGFRLPSS